ncbi:MAG: hypothetical protein N3A54_03815 [Patescibacteria group bacterium]|nr:hypothetical protein [Patescibacteria group bacterium]
MEYRVRVVSVTKEGSNKVRDGLNSYFLDIFEGEVREVEVREKDFEYFPTPSEGISFLFEDDILKGVEVVEEDDLETARKLLKDNFPSYDFLFDREVVIENVDKEYERKYEFFSLEEKVKEVYWDYLNRYYKVIMKFIFGEQV